MNINIKVNPEVLYDANNQPYLATLVPESSMSEIISFWKSVSPSSEDIDAMIEQKRQRDGELSHITLLSPMEYSRLLKQGVSVDFSAITDTYLKLRGLGSVDDSKDPNNKAWFCAATAHKVNPWREELGLPPKDLHITLGFNSKDVHFDKSGAPADKHTLQFKFSHNPSVGETDLQALSKKVLARREREDVWQKTLASAQPDPQGRNTIVLDADGVLLNWLSRFAEFWEKKNGMKPGSLTVVHSDKRDQWERFGLKKKSWSSWGQDFNHHNGWADIPLFEGVQDVVDAMRSENMRVCIVSSVPDAAREHRIKDMMKMGFDINDIFLVRSGDEGQKKSDVINKLNAGYFFDDDIKNFDGVSESVKTVYVAQEGNVLTKLWDSMRSEIVALSQQPKALLPLKKQGPEERDQGKIKSTF